MNVWSRPIIDEGHRFDSHLERDWAGFIAHIGLRWRREPFAIRSDEQGATTMLNVIARPDFFLPDIAVIFECKPTLEQEALNRGRWQRIANRTGLPVVVTTSRPVLGKTPPGFGLYREGERPAYALFVQCPDCTAVGLVSLATDVRGNVRARWIPWDAADLWLSPCRHRPRWRIEDLAHAAFRVGYPRAVLS